jgi:hypothetical protein
MKEVENPVVHISVPQTQFMNSVAQQVRLGPTQFVTPFRETLDSNDALVPDLVMEPVHPGQQRHRAILCGEEHNFPLRHVGLREMIIAILRLSVNAILR